MRKLRIGIVGCGRVAHVHLWGYRALAQLGFDRFQIVALCDRVEERTRLLSTSTVRGKSGPQDDPTLDPRKRSYGGGAIGTADLLGAASRPYRHSDWRELVAREDIDAVEIYAPPSQHHVIALEAIAHGKHVFIEKPMAVTVRACHEILRAAREAGVRVAVGHNYRFEPSARAVQWIVEVDDSPGVLASVAGVFGQHGVSIRSMEQEGLGTGARIAFITHAAKERNLRSTLQDLTKLDVVTDVRGVLRVIGD